MKRYERFLTAALSILAVFSCKTEEVPGTDPQPQDPVEDTSYEIAPSKLVLMDGGWKSADEFSVISGKQNSRCKAESGTEASKAVISTSLTDAVAVFPYSKDIEVSGSTIKVTIPSSQTGLNAKSLSFCAGKLGSQNVNMEDLCSRVTFTIKQEGLTSLEIKASGNASMSGKACVSFSSTGKASVSFEEAINLISISGNGTGIQPGTYTIVCGNIPASDNEEEGNLLAFTGKGSNGKTYSAIVEDFTIEPGNALELGEIELEEDETPDSDAEIKKISLVFIDQPNSTTFLWPFQTPTSGEISNSIEEGKGTFINQKVNLVMPEADGGYTFTIYSARGLAKNAKSSQGFKFGGAVGDYMTIPAIEGMYLVRVKLITGDSGNNGEPDICAQDGKTVLEGGSSGTLDMLRGDSHIWNIRNAGLSEPNMIVLTKADIFRAQILELTYSTSQTYDGGEDEGGETDPGTPPVDISLDEIPDFSRVGYHYGDKEIPDVPVITTLEAPSDGADATSLIQKAIDNANGPGAILLKAGKYNIGGTVSLNRTGVVLRGEGDKTILYSTANTQQSALIVMGIETDRSLGKSTEIVDEYTHCGQMYVRVADPSLFKVGDKAYVYRPATKKWLADIHMSDIYKAEKQWTTSGYSLYWERTVVSIEGDCLYLDNPIVMGIGGEGYGTGRVYTGTKVRISESGIENMTLDTRYDETIKSGNDFVDEAHCWSAISVKSAEHSWVRNITSHHFGLSCVILSSGSKNITVSNCSCLEPVSKVDGSRRYAFNFSSAQLCLVKDCTCDNDRHQYVCGSKVCGPNVFLRCTGTNSRSECGPHQRWATGILFDNVKVTTGLALHDRGNYGSGHGWAAANCVLYNCEAKQLVVQSPWASAQNWSIGCIGTRKAAARTYGDSLGSRIQGTCTSPGEHVTPESLYESQLKERHDKGIYLDQLP